MQPPDETLDDAKSSVLPTVQWPAMYEQPMQTSTRIQQQHQCPPHFVQISDVETVRISACLDEKMNR